MQPYAELLEFNQPNPIRKEGFTRIRDQFPGLAEWDTTFHKETGKYGEMYPEEAGDWVADPERIMEFAGRWDYGINNARKLGEMARVANYNEEGNMDGTYNEIPIIQKYIGMGHESMIEMGDATFFIECSRVVSHELVRHRLASYQQESQRFVKYDDQEPWEFFYNPATENDVIEGPEIQKHYDNALKLYKGLREEGMSPQLARYVLPNGTRTRLIMKTNIREWRHIIKLRLDKSAQPEMQELMQQIYDQLVDIFPNAMKGVLEGERGVR